MKSKESYPSQKSVVQTIKAGYKRTEVGLIPSDWEVKKLGDIGENIIGLTYSPNDVKSYGHLVLRSSNIQNNKLAFENNVFVEMELPNRVIVKENDILICVRNGSKHLIGKCALINKETEGSAFGAFMSVYRTNFAKFIFHQFQSNIIQKQIDEVMGATINQLTNKDLATFQIPLPKEEAEQTLIATALCDADALISSLEKLIAKKRNIKQGAMQKCLNPDFYDLDDDLDLTEEEKSQKSINQKNHSSDKWEVKKLGEVGKCHRGVSYNPEKDLHPHDKSITVRLLRSNNIQNRSLDFDGLQFVDCERVKSNQILEENDIVICMANGSKQLVGKSAIFSVRDNLKYTFGAFMGCFRTDESFAYSAYVAVNFQSYQYRNYIDVLLSGSSINNLNPSNIESINIPFPPLQEQTRIANILSDMDNEITALETKLEKYKKVKLGMMQNLLTGKIRLV